MFEPESVNLSWLSDMLAVGGSFSPDAIGHLAHDLRVRHVVDTRDELMDDRRALAAFGIDFLHVPTRDHHPMAEGVLQAGIEWVATRLLHQERVVVHCEHGIGRSVFFCACVLVRLGEPPQAALHRIKAARPCASPSPAQLSAFMAWCSRHAGGAPSFEELACIAYRSDRPRAAAPGRGDRGCKA